MVTRPVAVHVAITRVGKVVGPATVRCPTSIAGFCGEGVIEPPASFCLVAQLFVVLLPACRVTKDFDGFLDLEKRTRSGLAMCEIERVL